MGESYGDQEKMFTRAALAGAGGGLNAAAGQPAQQPTTDFSAIAKKFKKQPETVDVSGKPDLIPHQRPDVQPNINYMPTQEIPDLYGGAPINPAFKKSLAFLGY